MHNLELLVLFPLSCSLYRATLLSVPEAGQVRALMSVSGDGSSSIFDRSLCLHNAR